MENNKTKTLQIIFVPAALILLNFILKILFIGSQSIAGDEPFSIYYAQMDVSSIFSHLGSGNNPPLYEILLHHWIKLFGISPLSARFLPFLFSVATVYFIYRVGMRFFNFHIALTASLLYTFSNYHLFHSHESRVYSLFAFLAILSMYFFLVLAANPKSRKYYILLILSNALLIYAHYFGFFVLAVQLISLLCFAELRKNMLKNYSLAHLLVLIFYIPQLSGIISRFSEVSSKGTWLKPPGGIESLYNMLWRFSNAPVVTVICFAVLVISLLKLIIQKSFPSNLPGKIISIWFVFPFLFMFFISYQLPMFHDRYLIYITPAYYLLLAICADYLFAKNIFKNVLAGLLVILFAASFRSDVDNKRHVKEAITKIMELKDKNTLVIFCPAHFTPNFAYYYNINYFTEVDNVHAYAKMTKRLNEEKIFPVNSINDLNKSDLTKASKIIYLDAAADFDFPNNNILSTLQNDFSFSDHFKFYEVFNVYVFINKPVNSL